MSPHTKIKIIISLLLVIALTACSSPKNVYINVTPNTELGEEGGFITLTSPPAGFIAIREGPDPTPMAYSVGGADACEVSSRNKDGFIRDRRGPTGTVFTERDSYMIEVSNCTVASAISVRVNFNIGSQEYAGSTTFNLNAT